MALKINSSKVSDLRNRGIEIYYKENTSPVQNQIVLANAGDYVTLKTIDSDYRIRSTSTNISFDHRFTTYYLDKEVLGDAEGIKFTLTNNNASIIGSSEVLANVSAVTELIPVPEGLNFNSDFMRDLENNHSSIYLNDVEQINPFKALENDVVKIVVDDGYLINPTTTKISYYYHFQNNYISLNFSEDNKSFTFTIDGTLANDAFTPVSSIQIEEDVPIITGVSLNNVYLIDVLTLGEINANRYLVSINDEVADLDLGQFILSLGLAPVEFFNGVQTSKESIKLGYKTLTDVRGDLINSDLITLNMGEIELPNNSTILNNGLVLTLYLPFTSGIVLDSKAMGTTISIEAAYNVYTLTATYNIYSNAELIHSENFNLGLNVPFSQGVNLITSGGVDNASFTDRLESGILTPYIEVLSVDADLTGGEFYTPMIDDAKLIEFKGYAVVNDIKMAALPTARETELLNSLLKNGVHIL